MGVWERVTSHERMVLSFLALTVGCMVVLLRSETQEEKQVREG